MMGTMVASSVHRAALPPKSALWTREPDGWPQPITLHIYWQRPELEPQVNTLSPFDEFIEYGFWYPALPYGNSRIVHDLWPYMKLLSVGGQEVEGITGECYYPLEVKAFTRRDPFCQVLSFPLPVGIVPSTPQFGVAEYEFGMGEKL